MSICKFGCNSLVLYNTVNATHYHYMLLPSVQFEPIHPFLQEHNPFVWHVSQFGGTVFTVITFWASWNNKNLLLLFIINKWIDQCKKYQNIKEICLTFVTVCSNISIFTTVKAYSTNGVAGCIIFAIIITSFTAVYSKKSIWAFYNL